MHIQHIHTQANVASENPKHLILQKALGKSNP